MLPSSKVEIIQKKLLTYFKEETKMRKMPSLLNIDTRPCVKTETQKHQKLIDQFGFQIFIQFILSSAGGILSLTLTDSILFLSLRP